jgi:hypothetical protein
MRTQCIDRWSLVAAASVLVAGCSALSVSETRPIEFSPVPGLEGTPSALCGRDARGLVLVVVNPNRLNMPQGRHRISVRFGTPSPAIVNRASPLIGPESQVDMVFAIPSGCWRPDCTFTVWRDGRRVGSSTCFG